MRRAKPVPSPPPPAASMARVPPPMIETTSFRREADDARARPARKTGSEGISRDSKTMMISEPVHQRRTNAMKLDFIPLDKMSVSKANMRHGKKQPDISDRKSTRLN